jgi:hypothetical protein
LQLINGTKNLTVYFCIALSLSIARPLGAQQTEIRVRLLDAHSGKPFRNRHVELFGTNSDQGLPAKDTLFDVSGQTGADGVVHFQLKMPLPTRFVFWSAQANGCLLSPSFMASDVLNSGVVSVNTCAGKHQKYRWQDVTAQPGEIVIFAVEQGLAGW